MVSCFTQDVPVSCNIPLTTALYNPLLDDSHTKIIEDLTKTPNAPVPSLIELSARTICKHRLRWGPGDLPKQLESEKKI